MNMQKDFEKIIEMISTNVNFHQIFKSMSVTTDVELLIK